MLSDCACNYRSRAEPPRSNPSDGVFLTGPMLAAASILTIALISSVSFFKYPLPGMCKISISLKCENPLAMSSSNGEYV